MQIATVFFSFLLLAAAPSPQALREKERGDRLSANGEPERARQAYEKAAGLSKGYADPLNDIGILLVGEKKEQEAITYFRKAIAENPNFALSYNNLGFTLRKLGRHKEAVEAYQTYTRLDPVDPAGFYGLGEALKGANQKEKAVSAYQRCLAIAMKKKNEKFEEKAKSAAMALGVDLTANLKTAPPLEKKPGAPKREAVEYYQRALKLFGNKQYSQALSALDQAIDLQSDFAHAYAARGSAHFAMRDFNKALSDYAQAMRIDRTMATPVFGLAESLYVLGRKKEAMPYYRAYSISKARDTRLQLQEVARQRMAKVSLQ